MDKRKEILNKISDRVSLDPIPLNPIKIKENKNINEYISLSKSNITKFQDKHYIFLIIFSLFSIIICIFLYFAQFYNFVKYPIKDYENKLFGYYIINRNYKINIEDLDIGNYIYYKNNLNKKDVILDDLNLGQINRTSDLYVEINNKNNELEVIPIHNILYKKQ